MVQWSVPHVGVLILSAFSVRTAVAANLPTEVAVRCTVAVDAHVAAPTPGRVIAYLEATITASASWVRLVRTSSCARCPTIDVQVIPYDDAVVQTQAILTIVVRDPDGHQLASDSSIYAVESSDLALQKVASIALRGFAQLPHAAAVAGVHPVLVTPYIPPETSVVPRVLGWSLTGVGLAALGVGAWRGVVWQSSVDDFRTADSQVTRIDAKETGEAAGMQANVLVGVGGAVVAVGITFLLIDLFSDDAPVDLTTSAE